MLSVASTRTEPKSSAIITAPGEKCGLDLCILIAAAAWLLSVITRECSWVDRLWSLCPPAYCLIVAAGADFDNARLNVMTLLVILWGAA